MLSKQYGALSPQQCSRTRTNGQFVRLQGSSMCCAATKTRPAASGGSKERALPLPDAEALAQAQAVDSEFQVRRIGVLNVSSTRQLCWALLSVLLLLLLKAAALPAAVLLFRSALYRYSAPQFCISITGWLTQSVFTAGMASALDCCCCSACGCSATQCSGILGT